MAKLFKLGLLPSEVEEHYADRFGPDVYKYKNIDVKDSPVRGDPGAPVTIVEFSDFQCPHCKHVQLPLEQILHEYPQVKLVFKNYPITRAHPYAQRAAQAAVAAGKQGKFWQFHDKLFNGDQEKESPSDLERYARELHLDIPRWKRDTEAAADKVDKDRADGEKHRRRRDADLVHQRPQIPRAADLRRAQGLDRRGAEQMKTDESSRCRS